MLRIASVTEEPKLSQVRGLLLEYGAIPGVAPCLADFEREVAFLPAAYAPPGGRLLLATIAGVGNPGETETLGEAVGCVALRGLENGLCEMKRLYVRPAFRGQSAGRELVQALIVEARSIGYERMVLDTLPSMQGAHKLYRTLGFREISSYQKNPVPGSLFFEFKLR